MPASGNGIQLTTSGRLIVPAYHLSCSSPGNDVEFSHAMYSDDHGRTWSSTKPFGAYTSEGGVVELFHTKGALRWNARVDGPTPNCTGGFKHCRGTALSHDSGLTWSPMTDTALPDPMCKGTIVRWPEQQAIVVSNAFSPRERVNVSVSLSRDDGASYDSHAVVYANASGYSAMTVMDDGLAAVLFERGGARAGQPGFGGYGLCMVSAGLLDLKKLATDDNSALNGSDSVALRQLQTPPAAEPRIAAGIQNGLVHAGIGYTLSVPQACVDSGQSCGAIMDVHGGGMDAEIEDACDDMRASAGSRGFIVVQPSSPGVHWHPLEHHDELIAILQHVIELFAVDTNRVHVLGFSQGGFAAWNMLCRAPSLICSIAPLASSGLDEWGLGYGRQCFDDAGPAVQRSILLMNGVTDPLSQIDDVARQVQNVLRAYGIDDSGEATQGDGFTQRTWSSAEAELRYVEHSFEGQLSVFGRRVAWCGGHCFPTRRDMPKCDGRDGLIHGQRNYRCCGAFTWTEMALDFFEEHPCGGSGAASGCAADLTADGRVDIDDLLLLLAAFGSSGAGDIDSDGATSVADLLLLLSAYGGAC